MGSNSDSDDPVEEQFVSSAVEHKATDELNSAFSHTYYFASLRFVLENISAKNFIYQRKLDIAGFSARTDLVTVLKTAKLLQTVTKVDRFVRTVVFEFYTNLVPELTRAGKAYVRGHFYEFNPCVINAYFAYSGHDEDFDEDLDKITHRLTGGNATRWVSKDSIKAVDLTSSFAFLHKVALANWMPTTNHRYVTRKMAILLFKIDSGIQFDLGQLLFDQIIDARNGKAGRKDLIMPNLIYGLLTMQGFQKDQFEYYEAQPAHIKIDQRLLTGSHFDDLGLSREANTAGFSSSDRSIALTIEFLENELCLISTQRRELVDRELQVRHLLLQLKGFGTIGSDGQNPNDDAAASSESTSSSSSQSLFY